MKFPIILLFVLFTFFQYVYAFIDLDTPGLLSRCDRHEYCSTSSNRKIYSFDFLCCEDGSGWATIHVTSPLAIYIFTKSFLTTWFFISFSEVGEYTFIAIFGTFFFANGGEFNLESVTGILIGDELMQGMLGITIGILFTRLFDFPVILTKKLFRKSKRLYFKYIFFLTSILITALIVDYRIDVGLGVNRELNYGLCIATILQIIFIWGLLYSGSNTQEDEMYIWKGYSRFQRKIFFFIWTFIILSIHVQSIGILTYLPNDYYQSWVSIGIIIIIFTIGICKKLENKRIERKKQKHYFI